jgi:hypothetical protein
MDTRHTSSSEKDWARRRGVAKVEEYRAISAMRVRISEPLAAVGMEIVSHYRRTAGWVYDQFRF